MEAAAGPPGLQGVLVRSQWVSMLTPITKCLAHRVLPVHVCEVLPGLNLSMHFPLHTCPQVPELLLTLEEPHEPAQHGSVIEGPSTDQEVMV